MYKSNLFLKIQVLRERSSDITFFMEHSIYSTFKIYGVGLLVFYFGLPLHTQSLCSYKNDLFLES